jgi:molybdopterin-guanine dinucleotide biosynthesis protein MobB
MKPFIIGLYGQSNTGKTNLITNIIKKLHHEGYKVASVKKTDKKISIDTKQKDTWRYAKAGSELVVFSTQQETSYIINDKQSTDEIIKNINNYNNFDIILIEGSNDKNIPKIRFGNIKERENTILSYNDNFQNIYNYIKKNLR